MRTKTEIKLMNLRQKYRDYLSFLRALPVIQIDEYKRAFVRYQACDLALMEYRANHLFRDIA